MTNNHLIVSDTLIQMPTRKIGIITFLKYSILISLFIWYDLFKTMVQSIKTLAAKKIIATKAMTIVSIA